MAREAHIGQMTPGMKNTTAEPMIASACTASLAARLVMREEAPKRTSRPPPEAATAFWQLWQCIQVPSALRGHAEKTVVTPRTRSRLSTAGISSTRRFFFGMGTLLAVDVAVDGGRSPRPEPA
jgi:hypothetical protein